ncbi:hypothetical protein ANAEL_04659 [Anaerolineales bacterium]|nr:hypothetical protein ANAEL_04659 [Anaerolineales bacterium]
MFTHVAARMTCWPPTRPFQAVLQSIRYLLNRSLCFRLEREFAGSDFHRRINRALARHTQQTKGEFMYKHRRHWLPVLASFILSACGGGDDSREETIYVSSNLTECTSLVAHLCMLTRASLDAPSTPFYGEINGFQYEWGSTYRLKVKITTVANPPADSPSESYSLVEVLDKSPVPAATVFQIPIGRSNESITKTSATDVYRLHQTKDFACQPSDCQTLFVSLEEGYGVLLEFDHQNQPTQPLHLLRVACFAPPDTFRATCM